MATPPELSPDARNGPRSPLRTVQVLQALAGAPGGLALGELSTLLDLPKTSVFRLLRALESGHYTISKDGMHQIGPEALKLGHAIVRNREFPDCVQPALEWLSERCGETIILGVLADNGNDVIYSRVIEASNPLRFSINPGVQKPLYSSASGQIILAYMSGARIDAYLKAVRFEVLAPRTVTSVAELQRRLVQIRAEGIAVSVDGMFDGVYSVAAPVADSSGSVCAGVSISAPTPRALRHEAQLASLVQETGEEISRLLGYPGHYPPGSAARQESRSSGSGLEGPRYSSMIT